MNMRRKKLPLLLRWLILILVASISVVMAVDKDKAKFAPGPASSFASKQTNEGVTIAAEAYETEDMAKAPFGKLNPYAHGVLPVLVVIQNDSKETVSLEKMKVEYETTDRERIGATAARDVQYLNPVKRPNLNGTPLPGLGGRHKNPLASPEIEARAFAARMLPPGESAYGFLYFQTGHRSGAKLYLTGLKQAGSGKDLFYFEIPLGVH